MKRYIIILIAIFTLQIGLRGAPDSLKVKGKSKQTIVKAAKPESCIKDCLKECIEKCKTGTDYFIDKDGDGICDQRAKGMGFNSKNRCSESNCTKKAATKK